MHRPGDAFGGSGILFSPASLWQVMTMRPKRPSVFPSSGLRLAGIALALWLGLIVLSSNAHAFFPAAPTPPVTNPISPTNPNPGPPGPPPVQESGQGGGPPPGGPPPPAPPGIIPQSPP